ncbi:MAG TPA: ATP-binding protein [Terriglobales bacterium]
MASSPALGTSSRRKKQRAPFERRVARYSVLLVLPCFLASVVLIWLQSWAIESKLLLIGAELLACLLIGVALHEHIIRPLQTLANVVGALREEDYSFRARMAVPNDALGELSLEVNALADLLAQHRSEAIEATVLVQRVVEEVDIPIFAFDPAERLRLVNSAGQRLLQRAAVRLLGLGAAELKLDAALHCENESLVELHFGADARWFVRRSSFRQNGIPHTLLVLSDVSRALREEERRAWQRLIRVLGHELNNSLAPIKSLAGSLNARLAASGMTSEARADFERGLNIIESRAAALNRFLQGYRQLAQMPPPALRRCSVVAIAKRVSALETRVPVKIIAGSDVLFFADPDQLEQMLINLLRNAAEAVLQFANENTNGSKDKYVPQVLLSWITRGEHVIFSIEDNGAGLMNPSNAFVPFYTTKPNGSGIGLVLSRQIAEAHGGSLELSNRADQRGCAVTINIPLRMSAQSG